MATFEAHATFDLLGQEWDFDLRERAGFITGPRCTCDFPPPAPMRGLPAYCGECRASVQGRELRVDLDEPADGVTLLEQTLQDLGWDRAGAALRAGLVWGELQSLAQRGH